MMKSISIRLKEDFMKEARRLAELEMVDESVIIREALEKGMAEVKLEIALSMFSKGKVSTSEAAEIANLSIGEMMDEIVKRGLKPNIIKEDIKGSLKKALKVIK
jgi:predicted HTH domain antitoxin